MCVVAGIAIAGSAVVGAAGTMIASHQASIATRDAAQTAANEQNKALSEQAQLSQPYRDIGTGTGGNMGAIQQYQNLLGLNPKVSPLAALEKTPGYQFALQQGDQATVNQASAMGLGLSGNTLEGLSQFNQGLAQNTYQNAVGNAGNAVQIGQAAAAGQAANIGQAATNLGNIAINQGNTIAGIDANEAASLSKLATGAAGQYADYSILKNLAVS
jgi:hypothetical protein